MRFFVAALVGAVIATSSNAASPSTPEAQMEAFLKTLQEKKYDGALESFFAGSLAIQQKPTEMKAMSGQVKAAFEFLGPPTSWEIVETRKMGRDLVVLRLISKQKDETPVFWNAMFYRRLGKWEPLSVFFFDDPLKAGFLQ
jgi:hypothetical protein